jgi:hypothetical protein
MQSVSSPLRSEETGSQQIRCPGDWRRSLQRVRLTTVCFVALPPGYACWRLHVDKSLRLGIRILDMDSLLEDKLFKEMVKVVEEGDSNSLKLFLKSKVCTLPHLMTTLGSMHVLGYKATG